MIRASIRPLHHLGIPHRKATQESHDAGMRATLQSVFCIPGTIRASIMSLAITSHSVGALTTSEGLVRARERVWQHLPKARHRRPENSDQHDDAVRPGCLTRLRRGAFANASLQARSLATAPTSSAMNMTSPTHSNAGPFSSSRASVSEPNGRRSAPNRFMASPT